MRYLALAAAAILLSSLSFADGGHDHKQMPGEKLGTVNFPISCGAESQKAFNRAMAMQHSFWFEKAYETFGALAQKDPECAIAHWGMAMSQYHPLWAPPNAQEFKAGAAAVEKAKAAKKVTERERRYVDAIASFYADADKLDHRTRAMNYKNAMERLHQADPKDDEGTILYALALDSIADPKDKSYVYQKQCGETLQPLFDRMPNHPGLAHYLIHCYDNPALAPMGLKAARAYAKIAPTVPHAQHMPSHIFTRLGLWDEAIASNTGAAAAGRNFERNMKMTKMWRETAHALDYKHYALMQQGRISEAQKIVETFRQETPDDLNASQWSYAASNSFSRHAIETGDWKAAVALTPQTTHHRDADATIFLARAIGNARMGNATAARSDVENLQEIEGALTDPYWKGQVEIKRMEAQAWLAFAEGKHDEALSLAYGAADKEDATDKNPVTPGALEPAHEVIGDLLMAMKRPQDAGKEYEASLKTAPNRFHALHGAAMAYEQAGERENARKFYSELLKVAGKGDDSAALRSARKFVNGGEVAKK
jgi:tetratricopeptide (TPR) repeat protein